MNTYYYERQWQSESSSRITWATQRLILANLIAFTVQLLLHVPLGIGPRVEGVPGGFLAHWLAFQPQALLAGLAWKPFTYMFLHGGLMHLFVNMLWLFFFGPDVERALGTRQFIRFYILCGVLGVMATLAPFATPSVSVVGASGAVMGVLVAYAVINPERQFFLFPLPIPINARILVYIVIAINIISAIQPGGNTSVATHLGGMAVGFAYMKLIPMLRHHRRKPPKPGPKKGSGPPNNIGEAVDNIFKFREKKR